jgi:hypothetical protein
VTTRIRPPRPFGCRRPPPPPSFSMEPFEDELAKRLQLHAMMDNSLKGVLTPGDTRHVPPSRRLYTPDYRRAAQDTRARDVSSESWRRRWVLARGQDAKYLPLSALLTALGGPLLCRGSDPLKDLVAFVVGQRIHRRIMAQYREEYRSDEVSCDNRVFFRDGTSERLSALAKKDILSVYGGLNYCLAGQKCDIINLDRGEIWEIKPAGLASAALLQLWGYLDNYEVARVLAHYRREPALPPLRAGRNLPARVTRPFPLQVDPSLTLLVTPFTIPWLPGLILYTVRPKTRRSKADRAKARQAVAITSEEVAQALATAHQDMLQMIEVKDSETRRLLVYTAVIVAIIGVVAVAAAIAAGAAAAGAAATAEAAAAGAAAGKATFGGVVAAELASAAAGEIITLAARRAAISAVTTIAEATPKVAASITVYLAGREFTVPPETVGACIEGGCDAGEAVVPTPAPR